MGLEVLMHLSVVTLPTTRGGIEGELSYPYGTCPHASSANLCTIPLHISYIYRLSLSDIWVFGVHGIYKYFSKTYNTTKEDVSAYNNVFWLNSHSKYQVCCHHQPCIFHETISQDLVLCVNTFSKG